MSYGRALIRAVRYDTDWTKHVAYRPVQSLGSTETIDALLATPTWSVRSLLPPHAKGGNVTQRVPSADHNESRNELHDTTAAEEVTPAKLHHLLRLSALPLPKDQAEESRLLQDLRSQVHFVRHLQSVDTEGVTPLVAIRDETDAAREENKISLADVQPWLDLEEAVGKNGTVRRRKTSAAVAQQAHTDLREQLAVRAGKEQEENVGEHNILRWKDLPPSGNEEGRRWGKFYVVKRGRKLENQPVTPAVTTEANQSASTTAEDAEQIPPTDASTMNAASVNAPPEADQDAPASTNEAPPTSTPQSRHKMRLAARAAANKALLARSGGGGGGKDEDPHLERDTAFIPTPEEQERLARRRGSMNRQVYG